MIERREHITIRFHNESRERQHPMGTLDYGEDEGGYEPLSQNQQMHNPEYGIRMREFNDIRRAHGKPTPCQEDPQTWDAIDLEYSYKHSKLLVRRVDMERETERVERAMAGCESCPLLEHCKPLAEVAITKTRGDSYRSVIADSEGTIGGVLVGRTRAVDSINDYLATGEWPKGIRWVTDGDESAAG